MENVTARFSSITTFYFAKRTKIVVTKHVSPAQNIPVCVCGRGSALELAEEAYSTRSPDPLARFKGHFAAERKGKVERQGGRGRRNGVKED